MKSITPIASDHLTRLKFQLLSTKRYPLLLTTTTHSLLLLKISNVSDSSFRPLSDLTSGYFVPPDTSTFDPAMDV
jgi:hypothetical protein